VRVVEVDRLDAESAQRRLGGGADGTRGESAEVGVLADLRRDGHALWLPVGEPRADDRLALAAAVAGHPGAVRVGGVDEVAAACAERVEHGE
jgi:hypothetical protein